MFHYHISFIYKSTAVREAFKQKKKHFLHLGGGQKMNLRYTFQKHDLKWLNIAL